MASGHIKFWLGERGFGFIVPDSGGADVFCHVTDIRATGMSRLPENQRVTFETAPGKPGKLKAINVTLAR